MPPRLSLKFGRQETATSRMIRKLKFYERYGVEEYYIYDPDDNELTGCRRIGDELVEIAEMNGWTSPRLGIRFDSSGSVLRIYGPDGRAFLTFAELEQQKKALAQERDQVTHERDQVAQELQAERERVERLAAQLRSLGVEPHP